MSSKKLWVLTAGWDYEGRDVISVFDNEAEARAVELRYDNTVRTDRWYDFVEIHEVTLGEMQEELFRSERVSR